MKGAHKLVNVRNGAIVAASAAAAVASAWDRTHRHVTGAILTEADLRVARLSDLRRDRELLQAIGAGLEQEWGGFAFLGFDDVHEMAAEAGGTMFVVVERGAEGARARGIVQTTLADVHGDAELLEEAYPSFQSLTSRDAWKHAGGDTAVLLQITTLGPTERGGGLGSLLRNAVLNMLPNGVHYALTTTPVDGANAESIDAADPSTYTPAMRFHARGGANPVRVLRGYKTPAGSSTAHGHDVVIMRYVRGDDGAWPAKRPAMRVRRLGPVQERVLATGRSLRVRALKAPRPHLTISTLRRPSIHAPALPHVDVPRVRVPGIKVFGGLRAKATRLRHRDGDRPDESEGDTRGPDAAQT